MPYGEKYVGTLSCPQVFGVLLCGNILGEARFSMTSPPLHIERSINKCGAEDWPALTTSNTTIF